MIPQIREINFPEYATLHQATVNLSTMGDRTITTQIRVDGSIAPEFGITENGVFKPMELEFRGERFILPTREPQARKDTSTKNSLIDLTFYSWPVYELKRYFFVEMSSTTSGTAIADKYDAPLALNLENFVDAFNLVLEHYFNGKIQISLFGQGQGIYSTDPVSFEINYTKLWEVLQKVYEMYNVRWWFDYDSASDIYLIKMGYTADSIDDHDFSYGYKGGLLSFERTVQSDDLVNILLGRGGEKNLPYRYFKRTDPDNPGWTADPDAIPELANIYFDRLHDINFRWYVRGWMTNPERDRSWEQEGYVYPTYSISPDSPYYFAYQKGATDAKFNPVEYVKDDESIAAHGEVWGALDDNDDIYPTIQGVDIPNDSPDIGRVDEAVAISQIETDDISAYASAAAVETTIKDMKVSLPGNNVLTHTIYSEPFTIAQGETGNVTYRPFSKETVYPNFVYYDTTRSTLVAEPLSGGSDQPGTASYDEATGLYAVSGLPAGTYRLKLNLVLRVDSPATVATGTFGIENVVLTTSAANTNAWKPTFDIWVKNIWQTTQGTNESNKDYAERVWGPILGDRLGDEAKIVFSTGAMSISQDYEFVIADYPVPDRTKTLNGVPSEWKITVYKSDAEYQATGLYIPNASSTQPLAGDKFFFVGIDMPFQYVEWAEERLNQYKTDNLDGMSEISPTWTLKLDKVRINSLEDEDYGQKLADRLDAGVMIRTTDPRFTHGDILSLYIQSITWTWNEPSKGNPYIVPDVEVILADKVSAVESPISRLENDVDVISQTYVQSGDVEAVVRRVAGALFLKKTGESDSSSSPTTFSSKVTSRNFRKGGIGGAGWGLYEDNSRKFSQSSPATRADVSDEEETIEPRTVLEVDRLVVREEMEVNNLVINQISARGGREIISAARIETTLVRETSTSYVCYFDQKQNSVANLFQVNDIALGQVWSADNTELRFYKMLVTAVDVNSITLAKAGRYGSGSPQEGDVIVQYGNTTDARRQYVIIRDVVGGGHDRMLSGLNSVSAEGVEYYYAGVETGDTPRWFVGAREAEYAEYKDGVLNISGRLAVTSQLEKSDGSYVALSEYLNQLQDQVDGNIQTWFNAGEPSPLKDDPTATPNYPASDWGTATDKNKHLGDLYYNETTGKAYRYQLIGGNYVWGMISDEEIAEALRAAQAAAAAAATAQADADAAKARMDAWASDGVISPTEKQGIKDEIARIDSDHSNINAAYTLYGLGSPTAYNESYTAYRAQLVTLSASEPETITIPESFATNQISYYTQRTASLNAVDDAVKTGLTNLSTEIAGYNYLKRALGETTLVQGGLVLTSLIQLGQTESGTFNVYSGINGTFDQALPDPSRSIAAWYGGPMTDHEADPTSTTYAKSLFRMDGSGYLAGGMLNWGVENGQAFLNLNGEAVVGGLGGATLNDIANLMFEVVQYKSGHYAAKLKASAYYGGNLVPLDGLYAEGWMSAGGLSDTSSGGGASYLHELLDVNLPSQIGDGQALIWDSSLGDNGRWTSKNVSVDLTPFERTTNKVTSISASSTDGQYPSAKAVYSALSSKADSSALSGYLPLTGGTLNSGSSSPTLTLNTSAADSAIKYQQGGSDKAWIGYNAGAGVYLYNSIRSRYLSYKDDGSLLFENNKVWHAGNDGSGSGLDADLLDGWQGERYISYNQSTLGNDVDFNTISYNRGNSITIQPIHVPNYTGQTNIPVQGYGQMLTFGGQSSLFPFRIAHSSTSGSLYYQSAGYKVDETFDFSTGSPWRELAFTDSNVGSATKLQAARNFSISDATTAHTGQEVAFDGTASVVLPLPQIITANLIGTATGITENPFEDEVFAHQATPVRDIADGYRIDSIKGNTIVSDGELINNSAEAIETTGFNQWDENWEIGTYNTSTGAKESSGSQIRSKNLIPVIPGKRYYINAAYGQSICYDELINYISTTPWAYATGGYYLDIPSNAHYISFYMPIAYGTTYKNDICINLSCDRDGEYEPYRANRLALGLGSIKVKSGGNILEFNGLASAGDVYDELEGGKLIKRIGSYTLTGSESWTANGSNMYRSNFTIPRKLSSTYWGTVGNLISSRLTAATNSAVYNGAVTSAVCFTDSTSAGYIGISKDVYDNIASYVGTTIYYELATPVIYDLVSPVPLSGRIDGNGTMRVISDGPVAPFRGDITYGCNPGQMGADASSVKSYLDTVLEIKVVDGQPVLHSKLPLYSDSWISAGGLSDTGEGGGATYLKNLLDVDDNLVESAGYGLVYDGTQWTSEQIVPASRKINGVTLTSDVSLSLGSLSNVSVTGATNGQQLIYNGSEWIAGTPAGAKFFHGTCSTSSSSNTKVVDCPSFTSADLVAGTAIAIVMYNRSDTTSTVTINVNGTGANTLVAGFANRKAWSAQELILAVYDGSGVWDMLPTWYYTYYYGGGGSGGGGGTGSTVVVTPRLSSGTRIATITVDGSATDLYAPSLSISQTQGSTGGTQIASINSTAIYAPAVTVTQVQASGVEVARIKVGSANPVSIFAPSGSSGSSGVQTVVGRTGDVTTDQIATALTNAGYKLTDTVQDLSGYLPLTAGSSRALTNTLYTRGLLPTANASYDLGSLSAAYNNTYTKRVYLADGVYIEYDSTNRCVYVHGAGIATDSFVSAGGVSTTSN